MGLREKRREIAHASGKYYIYAAYTIYLCRKGIMLWSNFLQLLVVCKTELFGINEEEGQ